MFSVDSLLGEKDAEQFIILHPCLPATAPLTLVHGARVGNMLLTAELGVTTYTTFSCLYHSPFPRLDNCLVLPSSFLGGFTYSTPCQLSPFPLHTLGHIWFHPVHPLGGISPGGFGWPLSGLVTQSTSDCPLPPPPHVESPLSWILCLPLRFGELYPPVGS